jgi:hypothetical protein
MATATLFNQEVPAAPPAAAPPATPPTGTPPTAAAGVLPATPPAAAPPATNWLDSFKDTLPPEILGDPSLKPFTDVAGLIKSHVAAQKLIGADKIIIPKKEASEDDWKGIFQKLGNPEKLEDYKVKPPEGVATDDKFFKGFLENAHKAGILPTQAQKIVDFHAGFATDQAKELQAREEQKVTEEVEAFKRTEGKNYSETMLKMKAVVKQFDDDQNSFSELLVSDPKIGNSTKLFKFLSQIGNALKEDHFRGDAISNLGTTAEEAQAKINTIMGGGKDSPYWNKSHPDHNRVVQEVSKLTQQSMQA